MGAATDGRIVEIYGQPMNADASSRCGAATDSAAAAGCGVELPLLATVRRLI